MTFRPTTRVALLILALGLASLALAQAKVSRKTTTTKAPSETETTTSTKPPSDKRSTSSKAPDTTVKAKAIIDENPDDKAMKKLINDKSDEQNLLEKLSESYGIWRAWVIAHDGKTLNRFKASGIFEFIKKTMPTYFGGSKIVTLNPAEDSWLT